MRLSNLYKDKHCPLQPRYTCDSQCAKFISCMMSEIDSLYAMDGISHSEVDELNRELIKMVRRDNDVGT